MSLRIDKSSKLLMIGDSITDCGRARPIGEGRDESLGSGYVSLVDAMIRVSYPEHRLWTVNMGCSGNTVRDLEARWQTDVLDLKPDWLSIMIGINDVWRQFDSPRLTHQHVYADEYAQTLDRLVARTLPSVRGMVLMTPYYIEPLKQDAMRAMMDRYGEIVRETAHRHGTVFVDTQRAFDDALVDVYAGSLAWDRVHPNRTGHMVIARAFLNAIGYRF